MNVCNTLIISSTIILVVVTFCITICCIYKTKLISEKKLREFEWKQKNAFKEKKNPEPNEHEINMMWVDKLIAIMERYKIKDNMKDSSNEDIAKEIWTEIKRIKETTRNSKI